MKQNANTENAMGRAKRRVALYGALIAVTLVAACGRGPAPLAQNDPAPKTSMAKKAKPVRAISIDKSAYPAPPPRPAKVKIVALLLPLGDTRETIRSLAGHLYNGAQLALFDAPTQSLVISLHDTKGTAEGAEDAAKAAIAAGADIIVGPLFGSSVTAIQPVLAGAMCRALPFPMMPARRKTGFG